jgi:hypothetical protein
MGSFDELAEALSFNRSIPCFMATTVKRSSLEMEHSIRIVSIFDRDSAGHIIIGADGYEQLREYSARHGQSRASTTL